MDRDDLAGVVEARGDDVVINVHVQPRSGTTALTGRHGDALKLRVQAPPVDGRATEAARRLVADLFGVPATRVVLEAGERSRMKRFRVEGCRIEAARAACTEALAAVAAPPRTGG